ncbi:hypothetical protein ACNRWW_04495 [Metabacillus sp. HB246100]
MMYFSLFPIILLLLFIFGIFRLNKGLSHMVIFQRMNVKWIVGTYLILLVAGAIIYFMLPIHARTKEMVIDPKEINQLQQQSDALINAVLDGKDLANEHLGGVLKREKDILTYDKKELTITKNEEYGSIFVLIKRKETNDSLIEVTEYYTRSVISSIDLTDKEEAYQFKLVENQLVFDYPESSSITISKFAKEFPVAQFSGGDNMISFMDESIDSVHSGRAIYLEVPKDLEIIDPSESLIYVN